LLFGADVSGQVAETTDINRTHLLYEHSGLDARDLDLGSERCGPGTCRRRRYQDNRTR
jgi:hypothetical protein